MINKDETIKKCKRNFLHKHKENNRKQKTSKPSNNYESPHYLPMPHDDFNELIVKLMSNDDGIALSP